MMTTLGYVRRLGWYLAAAGMLLITVFLAISYGAKEMTFGTVYEAVFHYDPSLTTHQIIHDLRLPRVLTPVIILALLYPLALGRPLSFLALGEESASGLGVKTQIVRLLGMAAVVVLAGAAVSVAGSISFVGLAVPHIARKLVGVQYGNIIGLSALLGPVLLLWADFGARMINPPRELAIGILVAVIGVPFFLYLARQERREL